MDKKELFNEIAKANEEKDFDLILPKLSSVRPEYIDNLVMDVAHLHRRLFNFYASKGNTESANQNNWLHIALSCWSKRQIIHPQDHDISASIVSHYGTKEEPLLPFQKLPIEAFIMFWDAANNPIYPLVVQARFADVLWETKHIWSNEQDSGLPRPIDVARLSISKHIDAIPWFLELAKEPKTEGMEVSGLLDRAAFLASKVQFFDPIEKVFAGIRDLSQKWMKESNFWCTALFEIEVYLREKTGDDSLVTIDRLKELLLFLDDLPQYEFIASMPWIVAEILDLKVNIRRLLGNPVTEHDRFVERAGIAENEAQRHDSSLVKAHFLQLAASDYQQVGEKEKVEELLKEIRKLAKEALEKESTTLSFEEVIPKERVENEIRLFFQNVSTLDEALNKLRSVFFVSSLDSSGSKVAHYGSIIPEIMTTVPIVGKDRLQKPLSPGSEEARVFQRNENLLFEMQLQTQLLLSPIIQHMRDSFKLNEESLMEFLKKSQFWDSDEDVIVQKGVSAYFIKDYPIALHVLVPRLERFFRNICVSKNVDTTALQYFSMKEKTFGTLIHLSHEKGAIDEQLKQYLCAVLTEEWGLNLRNRIAHGFILHGEINQFSMDRILHIWLMLSGIA